MLESMAHAMGSAAASREAYANELAQGQPLQLTEEEVAWAISRNRLGDVCPAIGYRWDSDTGVLTYRASRPLYRHPVTGELYSSLSGYEHRAMIEAGHKPFADLVVPATEAVVGTCPSLIGWNYRIGYGDRVVYPERGRL